MLAASTAAHASCGCGCGDGACPTWQGECYMYNGQHFLNWGAPYEFEDVDGPIGTIVHTPEGTIIDNKLRDHSWTYCFEIPPSARHYVKWRASLDVIEIKGWNMAGVTIDGLGSSVAFRVDRNGRAELAFLKAGDSSNVIEAFTLPRDAARAVRQRFVIGIAYDIATSELACLINGAEVKRVTLPYYGIPQFASVVSFSMETTDPATTSDGTVTFGDFIAVGGDRGELADCPCKR